MNKRVVLYRAVPDDVATLLRSQFDVTAFDKVDDTNRARFIDALGSAHGILGNTMRISSELLDAAPHLEAASTISAGYDAFDVDELTRRGILLTNTPDEVTETTADLVFTLMLAAARRVVELAQWAKRGEWRGAVGEPEFGVDVHGKTLGIVGLGRIGGALARRAALGFGMRVLYSNRTPNRDAEARYGAVLRPLDELLSEADYVCLLVPLTERTRHLIGARELARMKSTAILINAARGAIVDEPALVDALREHRIRGAGLDVFEQEPLPPSSPLYALSNVVALPHIGSATRETRHAMARRAAHNLIDSLQGRVTAASVNPDALSARAAVREASPRA